MTARTKATPAEVEIAAIVGELVHDGFMDLDQADIIELERRDHASYRRIAHLFCVWALALVRRRMEERAEVDGEAAASIQAAAEMADEYATTETGVIEFGMCPP